MLEFIDKLLRKVSPSFHQSLKKKYRSYKKGIAIKLTKSDFEHLLKYELNIKSGDMVFVHSSMRNLYVDFDKQEILNILLAIVGPQGTLAFPCWQFNIRAEDYIKQNQIVFDIKNTPSAMGKIPDELRFNVNAYRSFHPTNSIIAIGRRAEELVKGHEMDIYPCGEQSPFYKLIKFNAKILGIGVTVDSLTFVHTVEDTMKESFPIRTRNEEVHVCKCIDFDGKERDIKTLVASKAITNRDVFGFFHKFIPSTVYRPINLHNMNFFSLKAPQVFNELKRLALDNKTIYRY